MSEPTTPAPPASPPAPPSLAGAPPAAGGSPPPPPAASDAPWYETLPDALKADPGVTRYGKFDDFVTAKLNLDKHFGVPEDQLVKLPGADDAAGRDALFARLGRPEKPDGYELPAAEGLPPLPSEIEARARETFHKLGLSKEQAQALWQLQNEIGLNAQTEAAKALEVADAAAFASLKGDWGPQYDARIKAVQDYVSANAPKELLGFLDQSGLATNPHLFRLVGDLVAKTSGPSSLPGAGAGGGLQGGSGRFTPQEARGEINRLIGDQAFQKRLNDAADPGHAQAVAQWRDLNALLADQG
jgi:hypothetical protein